MNKKEYIAPATDIYKVKVGQLLNTISSATSTNVDGLDVSDEEYEDVGRARRRYRNAWEDEEYDEEENL